MCGFLLNLEGETLSLQPQSDEQEGTVGARAKLAASRSRRGVEFARNYRRNRAVVCKRPEALFQRDG